jgi:hypothetical protein
VEIMNLTAPKNVTFLIAIVLAVLGLLAALVPLGALSGMAIWILLLGFIVLAASVLLPGL